MLYSKEGSCYLNLAVTLHNYQIMRKSFGGFYEEQKQKTVQNILSTWLFNSGVTITRDTSTPEIRFGISILMNKASIMADME